MTKLHRELSSPYTLFWRVADAFCNCALTNRYHAGKQVIIWLEPVIDIRAAGFY